MDNIINAINELRQKLIIQETNIDIAVIKMLEGYLNDAVSDMRLAKRLVNDYKIEL